MNKAKIMENIKNRFIDNPSILGREDKFITIDVKINMVIASWQSSIFAHEWLKEDGSIRAIADMSEKISQKRIEAATQIESGNKLPRPVLGIGITDNIEIGAGRDLLLTLTAMGMNIIPVHIPKSQQKDFKVFTAL